MSRAQALHTETMTAYAQTYATAATEVTAATAATVATTGATNSSPYGFTTSTQADALVTSHNALLADVAQLRKVLNQVIDDLQAAGMVD